MKSSKPCFKRSVLTYAAFLLSSSVIIACASSGPNSESKAAGAGEIPDEVSLKADRSEVDEARKNIPASTRKDNDELAAILGMMSTPDEEPSKVRDRFNTALRKKRDLNDKNLRERREEFSKKARSEREAFLKKAEADRKAYLKAKHSKDERDAFFSKQEDARKTFFSNADDRSKEFESKMTEDRKAFEDYARERQNQFTAQLRAYTESYQDRRNNLEKKRRAEQAARQAEVSKTPGSAAGAGGGPGSSGSGGNDPLEEWRTIPKSPGTELAPKGN